MEIFIELRRSQILNDVVARMNALARTLENDAELKRIASHIANPEHNDTMPILARSMTEGFDKVKSVCRRFLQYGRTYDDNRLEKANGEESYVTKHVLPYAPENYVMQIMMRGKTYIIDILNDSIRNSRLQIITSEGQLMMNCTMKAGQKDSFRFKCLEDCDKLDVLFMTSDEAEGDEEPNRPCNDKLVMSIKSMSDVCFQLSLNMPDTFNVGMTTGIKSAAHRMIVSHVLVELLREQWEKSAANYKADVDEQERILLSCLNSSVPFERHTRTDFIL